MMQATYGSRTLTLRERSHARRRAAGVVLEEIGGFHR
jgi:hypothetical protein